MAVQASGIPPRIQKKAVQFLRYQRRWIGDKSQLKLMVKSRRVGGSEAAAFSGACKAIGFDPCTGILDPSRGAPLNILSASHAQARFMLGRAVDHIREMEKLPEDVDQAIALAKRHDLPLTNEVLVAICDELRQTRPNAGHVVIKTRKKFQAQKLDGLILGDPSMNQCLLQNGAYMKAYAANPRTFRSMEGHIIGDEWGVTPHQAQMWAAMQPVAEGHLGNREGYTIELLGTPCGDDNMHYEFAMTEAGDLFSRHRIDIFTAVRDGFPLSKHWPEDPRLWTQEMIELEIQRLIAKCGLREIFEQEYNCAFLSASSRFLSYELVDDCTYTDEEEFKAALLKYNDTRSFSCGHDVANSDNKNADPCALVRNHRMRDPESSKDRDDWLYWMDPEIKGDIGVSFATQEAWIDDELRACDSRCRNHAPGFHKRAADRVGIDRTGMGRDMSERLVRKHMERIHPVDFTTKNKERMATRLKRTLERRQQRLPDDIELRRGLFNLHRYLSADGRGARYDVKKTKQGGHGDRAWALMLAQDADEMGVINTGGGGQSGFIRR